MKYALFWFLFILALIGEVKTQGECKDLKTAFSCQHWRKLGYCHRNSKFNKFMQGNCRKTCSLCTVATPVGCIDKVSSSQCKSWKLKNLCQYPKTFSIMLARCPSTCGFCPNQVSSECQNSHASCETWAQKQFCNLQIYNTYMKHNCRISCGLCAPSDCVFPFTYEGKTYKRCTNVKTGSRHWCSKTPVYNGKWRYCEVCTDLHKSCEPWASRGECAKNPNYMNINCRKSCGLCSIPVITTRKPVVTTTKKPVTTTKKPVPSGCTDTDQSCTFWANKGYCKKASKYFTYVSKKCPSSCKVDKCGVVTKVTTTKSTTKTTPSTTPKTGLLKCGKDRKNSGLASFIIAGNDAPRNVWVWQAGIYYYDEFVCGGTLITSSHVLTAAHCLKYRDLEGFNIKLGDHRRDKDEGKEQVMDVDKMWIHENYDTDTLNNDIGLMRLSKPAKLNKWVDIACLPQENEQIKSGSSCYITGWGKIEKDGESVNILQEGMLPIVPNSECGNRNKDDQGNSRITNNMLCAGSQSGLVSGCHGDSGGPFVCLSEKRWVVHGAVSWGSPNCDNKETYTVFARVSRYIKWIKKLL